MKMIQPAKTWGKSFPGTGNSKCKSPEASKGLGLSWSGTEAIAPGWLKGHQLGAAGMN